MTPPRRRRPLGPAASPAAPLAAPGGETPGGPAATHGPGAGAAKDLDQRKLAAARLWAVHRFPYLAAALFAPRVVSVPELGTAAVDEGWRLYVDPTLVDELDVEPLGSVLVHQVSHLLRDHADRARRLDAADSDASPYTEEGQRAARWRLAADLEINDDLAEAQVPLPADFPLPQQIGWQTGRLAEEYYADMGEDEGPTPECGSGAHALHREWELPIESDLEPLSPEAAHLLRHQVATEVLEHQQAGTGDVPGGWQRWAQGIVEPVVDWRRLLAAELRQAIDSVAGAVDYAYRRPSRRAGSVPDVVLPAMRRPVPEVAVVCDTSKSMSDDDLARVLGEVEGVLRGVGVQGQHVRVLSFDTAGHTVQRVAKAADVTLTGGGGTDMRAGIAAALTLRPRPTVVVVLTDGRTGWPTDPPRARVIVGVIGREGPTPPRWARVVRIQDAA